MGVGVGPSVREVEAPGMCLKLGAGDSSEREVGREVNPSEEKEGQVTILRLVPHDPPIAGHWRSIRREKR